MLYLQTVERWLLVDIGKFFLFLQVFEESTQKSKFQRLSKQQFNSTQNISLTRKEFADILGLRPSSDFINNMFTIVDRDKNGYISFKEYLDFFVVLAKGSLSQFLFDVNIYMYVKSFWLTFYDIYFDLCLFFFSWNDWRKKWHIHALKNMCKYELIYQAKEEYDISEIGYFFDKFLHKIISFFIPHIFKFIRRFLAQLVS